MKTFTHEQPEELWGTPTIAMSVSGVWNQGWDVPTGPTSPPRPRDYEQYMLRLSMPEGGSLEQALVTRIDPPNAPMSFHEDERTRNDTVHLMVQVIGFRDEQAPTRNWGAQRI